MTPPPCLNDIGRRFGSQVLVQRADMPTTRWSMPLGIVFGRLTSSGRAMRAPIRRIIACAGRTGQSPKADECILTWVRVPKNDPPPPPPSPQIAVAGPPRNSTASAISAWSRPLGYGTARCMRRRLGLANGLLQLQVSMKGLTPPPGRKILPFPPTLRTSAGMRTQAAAPPASSFLLKFEVLEETVGSFSQGEG